MKYIRAYWYVTREETTEMYAAHRLGPVAAIHPQVPTDEAFAKDVRCQFAARQGESEWFLSVGLELRT